MENDKNITFTTDIKNSTEFQDKNFFVKHVLTCIIISIGLPLTLVTIYALSSLIRKDHVAPNYVINLLITDFFQLCCLIVSESVTGYPEILSWTIRYIYPCLLFSSVGFMVCVSLERYLVIAHPLWYRFRRNIRTSVVVCAVVWVTPPVFYIIMRGIEGQRIAFFIVLIVPFPFFIFFLVGTLRALSASLSVSSDEKRQIVGILVLVLLIYSLLFLPCIISVLPSEHHENLQILSFMFLKLSPLADLSLYIFIKKETFAKFLAATCCCKKENNDSHEPAVNVDDI